MSFHPLVNFRHRLLENFQLAPGVISAIGPPGLLSEVNKEEKKQYPLTESQKARLAAVINLFQNYAEQGLGKTSLLSHEIDVGTSKPIKQCFYPVSP